MKRIISIFVTLLILLGINYAVAYYTNTKFIDYSFGVGLVFSIIIWFFTSKGGLTSRITDGIVQMESTNFKLKADTYKFSPNAAFFTSLAYTLVAIIITFYYYRQYFF
ncbi:hypothetical protein AN964_01290 [Heyndrickxia shackletonii]|uniref:DUF3899 domain-containing protein n=1 Tax=Heyndrickxia shackletonii TaxID=157838 RepID=A0A0Q3TE25_9BACI|nr:hypothetical protein [Heyndrickxia shackletonii]KQL52310.1 hypothetical protein AN964_01290 [Heyndrickxia shackletonii]NEZ00330.1 hypothetical protein [Heyndrickxia shackletonii]